MVISLNVEPPTHEAAVAAVDALRTEFEARGVPVKDGRWGYRLLVVEDLDGNQLFFPYPERAAGASRRPQNLVGNDGRNAPPGSTYPGGFRLHPPTWLGRPDQTSRSAKCR